MEQTKLNKMDVLNEAEKCDGSEVNLERDDDLDTDENNNVEMLTTDEEDENFLNHVLQYDSDQDDNVQNTTKNIPLTASNKPVDEGNYSTLDKTDYVSDSGTLEYFDVSADSSGHRLTIDEDCDVIETKASKIPDTTDESKARQTKGSTADCERDKNYIYTMDESEKISPDSEFTLNNTDEKTTTCESNIKTAYVNGSDVSSLSENEVVRTSLCSTSIPSTSTSLADSLHASHKDTTGILIDDDSLLNGDKSLSKFDWSKYFNPAGCDSRDSCTPDTDLDRISPDLFYTTQLSPNAIYGKDHMIGFQRLFSRQSTRSDSTLNTPDPVLYDDTDSNDTNSHECVGTSRNSNSKELNKEGFNDVNGNPKGTKRKFSVTDMAAGQDMLLDPNITSIINQGRPPDISTWTAVSSSCYFDSTSQKEDQNDQRSNKPMCAVPPVQTQQSYNSMAAGNFSYVTNPYADSFNRISNPQYGYQQSVAQNRLPPQGYCNNTNQVPQDSHSHVNTDFFQSCQFSVNQYGNMYNYNSVPSTGPFSSQACNQGFRSSAAYRLDFSSPVNLPSPGVLNFVSNPSYLVANLARPTPVHASNFNMTNMNYNTCQYPSNQMFPVLENRMCFNNENRSFKPVQQNLTQQQQCFRNTMGDMQPSRMYLPSATQSYAESQRNVIQSTDKKQFSQNTRDWSLNVPESSLDANNNEVDESFNFVRKLASEREPNGEGENKQQGQQVKPYNQPWLDIPRDSCSVQSLAVSESSGKKNLAPSDTSFNKSPSAHVDNGTETEVSEDERSTEPVAVKSDKLHSGNVVSEAGTTLTACCSSVASLNNQAVQSNEADSTTIDLTGESADDILVDRAERKECGSPTPAHSYPKIQNKFFTELYLKKSKTGSPISAFCDVTELSKQTEAKRNQRPSGTSKILPCAEPVLPVASFLNSMQAPTLAYSGTTLVPYMNSIFTAIANMNKIRTAQLYPGNVGTKPESCSNSEAENLAAKQQELISNIFRQGLQGVPSQSDKTEVSVGVGINSANSNLMMYAAPRMNVNPLPLPLYAPPVQCTFRPMAPLVAANAGLMNPLLYRMNIGVPCHTNSAQVGFTATPMTAQTVDCNNNNNPADNCKSCEVARPSAELPAGASSTSTAQSTKTSAGLLTKKRRRRSEVDSASQQTALESTDLNQVRRISTLDSVNLSIQGSKVTAPTSTYRGLTTYQPVPEGRGYMLQSDRKTSFRPRHFPFASLQIGSYKYTTEMYCHDKVSRVKLLFSRKVMVYEFQLDRPGRPIEMVEIEVPFKHIVSLWLYDRDMRVEVKEVPRISLGRKVPDKKTKYTYNNTVFNREAVFDVTMGQLSDSPYHYVHFKSPCANRVKSELCQFDSKFEAMLRLPLIEDPAKTLRPGNRQITSQLLDPSICLPVEDVNNNRVTSVYQPCNEKEASVLVSCACTHGCSSSSCKCCVRGTTCTEGLCECSKCRNPLNILHQLGLPADSARTDPCLMENIYQIARLDCYVKTQLILECCLIPVLLFNCIPGEVKCPNHQCAARYKYSWCTARLCNEDVEPRNHCVSCGRCTDFRNAHCQKCNICYFAGETHFLKCPICQHEVKAKGLKKSTSSTDSADV